MMNNDDERDFEEERANAQLMLDEERFEDLHEYVDALEADLRAVRRLQSVVKRVVEETWTSDRWRSRTDPLTQAGRALREAEVAISWGDRPAEALSELAAEARDMGILD